MFDWPAPLIPSQPRCLIGERHPDTDQADAIETSTRDV